MKNRTISLLASLTIRAISLFLCLPASYISGSELFVGTVEVDITPKLPVALMGQFHLRIADEIQTPLKANIVALETRGSGVNHDTVIFVSCDLIWVSTKMEWLVRKVVENRLPGFDGRKIILNGTHTHTGPVIEDLTDDSAYFYYNIPNEGVTQVSDYRKFLVEKISNGILKAWKSRDKGSATWGLKRAAIPYNRRVIYKDGRATMYGNTITPDFKGIEGYEDHDINTLFFWNGEGELISIVVNVSCPSQHVERERRVDADFWHPVREGLKAKYSDKLVVLGWTGASGDQSPRPIYRKEALERMKTLSGETRMDDISKRIVNAVEDTYDVVDIDKKNDVYLKHKVKEVELPMRVVTTQEYIEARIIVNKIKNQIYREPQKSDLLYVKLLWNEAILDRYQAQRKNPDPQLNTWVHVVRLGDVAICTNQFELFTDYGLQIKSRSKALQTFVIQLAGPGSYLPTEKAVDGGSYSAICQSNLVGPAGGQLLVEESVEMINDFWSDDEMD